MECELLPFVPKLSMPIYEKALRPLSRFLLAQLHIGSVASKDNLKAARKALSSLPGKIFDTYDAVMKRIQEQDEDKARRAEQVLKWISCACRPLRVRELQYAVSIEPDDTEADEEALPDEDCLLSVCAGLVTVDKQSSVIRLVHYTAQEYFERNRDTLFPNADAELATISVVTISVTYLSLKPIRLRRLTPFRGWDGWENNPFLSYAASYWDHHAKNGYQPEPPCKVLEFLAKTEVVFASLPIRGYQRFRCLFTERGGQAFHYIPGLVVAAAFGLDGIITTLLEKNVDKDSSPRHKTLKRDALGNALFHAVANDEYAAVRVLLMQDDILLNMTNENGLTPLNAAAYRGAKSVAELLLAKEGIQLDLKDVKGQTALSNAILRGHEGIMTLLVQRDDIDVNSRDDEMRTPLIHAVRYGDGAMVESVLARADIDVNCSDRFAMTAFWYSILQLHDDHDDHNDANMVVAKVLLERASVDINTPYEHGIATLYLAILNRWVDSVHYTLKTITFDVNAKPHEGFLLLLAAMATELEDIVVTLLEREDIDANCQDGQGQNLLHYAARRPNSRMVEILLAHLDVTTIWRDWRGRTPWYSSESLYWLASAESEQRNSIMRLLQAKEDELAKGDPTIRSRNRYGKFAPEHPFSYANCQQAPPYPLSSSTKHSSPSCCSLPVYC